MKEKMKGSDADDNNTASASASASGTGTTTTAITRGGWDQNTILEIINGKDIDVKNNNNNNNNGLSTSTMPSSNTTDTKTTSVEIDNNNENPNNVNTTIDLDTISSSMITTDNELRSKGTMLSGDFTISDDEYEDALVSMHQLDDDDELDDDNNVILNEENDLTLTDDEDDEENVMNISDDDDDDDDDDDEGSNTLLQITNSPAESYYTGNNSNPLSPPNAMKSISPPPSPPTNSPSYYKQQQYQQQHQHQYFYRGKPPSSPHSSRMHGKAPMIPQAPLLPPTTTTNTSGGGNQHPPRPEMRSNTESNIKNMTKSLSPTGTQPPHPSHKQNASFDSSLLYSNQYQHPHNQQQQSLSSDNVAFAARKRTISAHSSDAAEGMEGLLKVVNEQDKEMHERLKRKIKQVGVTVSTSDEEQQQNNVIASATNLDGVGAGPLGFAMERFLTSLNSQQQQVAVTTNTTGTGNSSGPESTSSSATPNKEQVARAIAELQQTESQVQSGEILINMPDPRVPQMYNDILMPCGSDATSSLLSDLIPNDDNNEDNNIEIEEIRLQETGDALIKEIEQGVIKDKLARDHDNNLKHEKDDHVNDDGDFDSLSDGSMFEDAIDRKLSQTQDNTTTILNDKNDNLPSTQEQVSKSNNDNVNYIVLNDNNKKIITTTTTEHKDSITSTKTTPFSDGDKLYMSENLTIDGNSSEIGRDDRLLSILSSVSSTPGGEEFLPPDRTLFEKGISSSSLEISESSFITSVNNMITPLKSNSSGNTNALERSSSLSSAGVSTTTQQQKMIPPLSKPPLLDNNNRSSSLPLNIPNNAKPPPFKMPPSLSNVFSSNNNNMKKTHRKMRSDVPTGGSKLNPMMMMMNNNSSTTTANGGRNRTFSTGNIRTNRARTASQGGDDLRSANWKSDFTKNTGNEQQQSQSQQRPRAPSSTGNDIPPTIITTTTNDDDILQPQPQPQQENRKIRPGKVPTKNTKGSTKKMKHKQYLTSPQQQQEPLVVDDFDYDKYEELNDTTTNNNTATTTFTPLASPSTNTNINTNTPKILPSNSYHSTTSTLFMENINKRNSSDHGTDSINNFNNNVIASPMLQQQPQPQPQQIIKDNDIPPPPPPPPPLPLPHPMNTPSMYNNVIAQPMLQQHQQIIKDDDIPPPPPLPFTPSMFQSTQQQDDMQTPHSMFPDPMFPLKQDDEIPPPPPLRPSQFSQQPPLPHSIFSDPYSTHTHHLSQPPQTNNPYYHHLSQPPQTNNPYYLSQPPHQPPMLPPGMPPPSMTHPSNFFMPAPPPPQMPQQHANNNPYYPMHLQYQQNQFQHQQQSKLPNEDETVPLIPQQPNSSSFFYPYGGINNNINNTSNITLQSLLHNPQGPMPHSPQHQQQPPTNRSTIFSSVLTSITRTTSYDRFENIESEKYVYLSCTKRAIPDRFLGLLFTLVLELPVWISMNNSEDLCELVGRRKYMIFMAFLPLCCAISGNCGLQTSTLTTRAINFNYIQRSNYGAWMLTELFTTTLLGTGIGLFITLFAFQASGHDFSFAVSIGLAQCLSILLSAITGCISPIFLACVFSFGSSRQNDIAKWNGWLEIILQDLIGAFCMMVLGIQFLHWFGVDEIEIGDSCGSNESYLV